MARSDEYRPRIPVEVSQSELERWRDLVPHGLRTQLLQVVISDVLDLIEKRGNIVIAMVITRKLSLTDVSPTLREVVRNGDDKESTK